MKPSKSRLLAIAVLILLVSLAEPVAAQQQVRVVNTPANPVPTSAQGTTAVAGTVDARQSGTWNVGIAGTPNVAVTGTPNVNVANTPTVQAQQSGAWNVGITGTPSVSLAGTPSVSIAGTPTVNVANLPASSGVPTAALFQVGVEFLIQSTTLGVGRRCRVLEIRGSWIRCQNIPMNPSLPPPPNPQVWFNTTLIVEVHLP